MSERGVGRAAAPVLGPPIPSLVRWGLSPDADLVYRTLTAFGPRTCSRIARELGLARHRAQGALEELAAGGAVRPSPRAIAAVGAARPADREWIPLPVERVLMSLRRRRVSRGDPMERWRQHVSVVAQVDAYALDASAARPLPSRQAARRRIAELVSAERHEHLAINTEEVISSDAANVALPQDRALVARGVKLRVLGYSPVDGDQGCAHAEQLSEVGGEYREAEELPLKLMVFDRRVALFPADPTNFEAGAIEVVDPTAVEHLSNLFYRLWTAGRDPRRKGVPPIVLTSREQTIVSLLTSGHSEASAALQLGLSRRTVVYTLRALMDRLGVENRFQLALVLGATGATPLPSPYQEEVN